MQVACLNSSSSCGLSNDIVKGEGNSKLHFCTTVSQSCGHNELFKTRKYSSISNSISSCNTGSIWASALSQEHWRKWKFCDVVIIVDSERFPCHRIILATDSPVLARIFNKGMVESKMNEISLEEVKKKVWKAVVQYVYTGKMILGSIELALSLLECTRWFNDWVIEILYVMQLVPLDARELRSNQSGERLPAPMWDSNQETRTPVKPRRILVLKHFKQLERHTL